MITYKDRKRNKAFIGAIIGAAATVAGGIIKGQQEKKAQQKAQEEQNHKEALQNAQALTASYANQDYIDQYKNKFNFKCGGRHKAAVGSLWEGSNTEIPSIINGTSSLLSSVTGTPQINAPIDQTLNTVNNINTNRKIANDAQYNKEMRGKMNINTNAQTNAITTNQRNQFVDRYKCGGRKKAWIGAAIGAAGSLLGSALGGNNSQKQIQVESNPAATYSAPKTGLVVPNWQNTAVPVEEGQSQPSTYNNRLKAYKLGGRRCR